MPKSTPVSDLITGTVIFNRMVQDIITKSVPLTLAQYRILFYLAISTDSYRRIRDISSFLFLSTSTVSDAANHLEAHGLIDKFDTPSDLKAVKLAITEKGILELEEAWQALLQGTEFYWDLLGEDTADHFLRVLPILFSKQEIDSGMSSKVPPKAAYSFFSRIHLSSYVSWFKSTYNLSLIDVRILFLLSEADEPLRISDISHLLNEPASSISSSTRNLSRVRKFITRSRNPSNRRETIISLSSEGKTVAREIMDRFTAFCCNDLNQTPEEFQKETLGRVHNRALPTMQDRLFGEKLSSW